MVRAAVELELVHISIVYNLRSRCRKYPYGAGKLRAVVLHVVEVIDSTLARHGAIRRGSENRRCSRSNRHIHRLRHDGKLSARWRGPQNRGKDEVLHGSSYQVEQKIIFVHWPRGSNAFPVHVGCVKLPAAMVGTPTGHDTVGCVNVPAAIVGTPAGHDTVGCVNVPPAIVGGFAGHEIVCVWAASAEPVKVSAPTVKELPGETVAIFENAPALVPASEPLVVATLTVPFVPAGVPALTDAFVGTFAGQDIAPSENAPLAFVGTPAGQESAPSANAPLAFVGTPAGQLIAPSEYAPLVFVPVGVIEFEPPVVPTSPAACVVPRSICPESAETSVLPAGQEPLTTRKTNPLGSEKNDTFCAWTGMGNGEGRTSAVTAITHSTSSRQFLLIEAPSSCTQ